MKTNCPCARRWWICWRAKATAPLTAADGASGLQRALDEKPDLILLDVMLPKLDGFAVCAELRRLANAVPVLMLTAKGQIEDRVTGPGRRRGRLPGQTLQHG